MALVRLVIHFKSDLLASLTPVNRAKVTESIDSLVSAGVVALLLVHFLVRPFYIPSGSMLPTLQIGDLLLVNKAIYDFTDPVRGDIVVFHTDSSLLGETPPLIKRVVALEYDTWEIKEGKFFLNGHEISESYVPESIEGEWGPETVKKGHFVAMGDNRNNSRDSRYIGSIPMERLVGRAEVIIFPFGNLTSFNFPR